jgi:hypothetical protein
MRRMLRISSTCPRLLRHPPDLHITHDTPPIQMMKHFWLPLAAAALTAGTASAQRPLVPGEITRGSLASSDLRSERGSYYDAYTFQGRRGETVIVQMESRAFDDDGGDGRNSRIQLTLPDDGTYVVRASSLSRSTGQYTLTLSNGGGEEDDYGPEPIDPVRPGRQGRGGIVQAGERIDGYLSSTDPTLDGGEPYHLYTYQGRRGERLTVELRSTDFDSYLVVGTRGGRHGVGTALARDDDGGGQSDSRIDVTLPADGEFVIRVNPLAGGQGSYTLDVTSDVQGGYAGRPGRDDPYDPRPRPGRGRQGRGGPVQAGERVDSSLSTADPTLDGGERFHLYTYQGRRGERLTVTLRSTDFDSYLVVGTRGGRHGVGTALARDDDGGGGRDARVDVTLPTDGEFVIRVNPLGSGTGAYTLEVMSDVQGGYDRPGRDDYDGGYDDGGGTELDRRLIGRWGLVTPGMRVDTQSWPSIAANANFGYLDVTRDGTFTWDRNGRTRRGVLEPFTPRGNAAPNVRYYRITDGREEFYVSFTNYRGERYMQVNSVATGQVAAYGYLDPSSRR